MARPNAPDRFNEEKATYVIRGSGEADDKPDLERGVEAIRNVVRKLPTRPGVYRMLDARGDVLYVGKARALKNRVTNYTQVARLPQRLQRMVSQTRAMTIVTTKSEAEALLLEAQLIKRYRPPYNVLLRDDKSFPFILLREDHDFPRIQKHRGARRAKGQLLRAVRQRRVGQPDAERAAKDCSCCAAAPTVSSPTARGRACCTRSSAARRRASSGSARRTMPSWSAMRRTSSTGTLDRGADKARRRDDAGRPKRWISSRRRCCATG